MQRKLFLACLMSLSLAAWPSYGQEPPADTTKPADALAPAPTGPPSAVNLEQAKKHYQKGLKAYQAGRYQDAILELKKAYLLVRKPALLLNIARTYQRLGDNELTIFFYRRFLKEAAPDDKQRPEVEKALKDLDMGGDTTAPATAPPTEPATPPTITPSTEPTNQPDLTPLPASPNMGNTSTSIVSKFTHVPIDEAPPNTPIDVRCQIPKSAVGKLILFYRAPGHEEYSSVQMRQHFNEWVGRIPASALNGRSVQYYIIFRDESDKVLAKSGEAASPNIVLVADNAPSQYYADLNKQLGGVGSGSTSSSSDKAGKSYPATAFTYGKWITSGAAVALLAAGGVGLYQAHTEQNSLIQAELKSGNTTGDRPSSPFNASLQHAQAVGQSDTDLGTIGLAIGGVAVVSAGVLWYLDYRSHHSRSNSDEHANLLITPTLLPNGSGLSALGTF